ncbi:virulence factor [Burkholderia cepacia]|uniref:virulence factor n=1 Tax=Burkholderia cepacia TaxID=292 RepID=UPI001FC7DEC5|nr:virulence factor [Burkholderia cepacia]
MTFTLPKRLMIAVLAFIVTAGVILLLWHPASALHTETLTPESLMKRLIVLPLLVAAMVLAFTTAWWKNRAPQVVTAAPAVTAGTSIASEKPFMAQVVGLVWLNPLQRRDYPTEWQALWTMGLVKPNKNDDMVRTDPKSFTTLQSVAGIADGNNGEETFQGFYHKYIETLTPLFGEKYVMNPDYFYTVKPENKKKWREVAGIHVEAALPSRLDAKASADYLRDRIMSEFEIGNKSFPDLWSDPTPPDVHAIQGGPNAGFTSLSNALDYLRAHPDKSVWVLNWDAPSFPPNDEQMNENLVMLILTGPEFKTQREPLAWIGRPATGDTKAFEAKVREPRAVQAWKVTIEQAAKNAEIGVADLKFIVHDAGHGSDAASARLASLSQSLTETLPEYDHVKQTFNTAAVLGDMGTGSALTDVVLAIGRANHLGGNTLVAGTTDPDHPVAVVVKSPSKLTPIDPDRNWFRAAGEGDAYLPWWGKRFDGDYPDWRGQGYSY